MAPKNREKRKSSSNSEENEKSKKVKVDIDESENLANRLIQSEKEVERYKKEAEEYKKASEEYKKEADRYKAKVEAQDQLLQEKAAERCGMLEELCGMVECPVCLLLPKEGPVPMCPNGHHVCIPCKEKMRKDEVGPMFRPRGAPNRPKHLQCPSCKVAMGEATSLLATRVIERVEHECEFLGCQERVLLEWYRSHTATCLLRLVTCPAAHCDQLLAFNSIIEHVTTCKGISSLDWLNKPHSSMVWTTSTKDKDVMFQPVKISLKGGTFIYLIKRQQGVFSSEVVMLGNVEDCNRFMARISLVEPTTKQAVVSFSSRPRPVDREKWGDFCLTITQKTMEKVWQYDEQKKAYSFCLDVTVEEPS